MQENKFIKEETNEVSCNGLPPTFFMLTRNEVCNFKSSCFSLPSVPGRSRSRPATTMTPVKADYYAALPFHMPQNIVVLTPYYQSSSRRRLRILCTVSLILLAAVVYVLWPSDPDVKVVRLRLKRIHIHTIPRLAVDISMSVTVRVRNTDVYSMDYRSLKLAVAYRGKKLGHVRSKEGHVRARGSSYVNAELEFDGIELLGDLVHLLEDLSRGTVPFDTVTEIKAQLGLLFFQIPLLAKVSCQVLVNTINQTIARQNCSAE